MRMTRKMKWIALVFAALSAALVLAACGDDGVSTTAPSIVSGDAAVVELASARAHGSGDDDDSDDDASDDRPDDVSDDDDSDDDDSEDNSDDDSDDGGGGSASSDGDDARVRGLFFGIESCPSSEPDCVVALRIKDTLVIVTNETRVDNEPALIEDVPPSELSALLGGRLGLPLRARGVGTGSGLVASELRIDDEIQATGIVGTPAPGCEVSLLVRGNVPLCFSLSAGVAAPSVGSAVRIEGVVVDLVSPYRAVEIERSSN